MAPAFRNGGSGRDMCLVYRTPSRTCCRIAAPSLVVEASPDRCHPPGRDIRRLHPPPARLQNTHVTNTIPVGSFIEPAPLLSERPESDSRPE
jgi:hypothetical protein